jgi:hypothetical protein
MKVLLIAPDSKIPNLALMKLSTWHKNRGDIVGWNVSDPDLVYISQIFEDTLQCTPIDVSCKIVRGGPGYDPTIKLPVEVEQCRPDYSLYPNLDYSLGYISRGCPNHCYFCKVPKMEKDVRYIQHPSMFYNTGYVRVFDDNILACKEAWDDLHSWSVDNDIVVSMENLDATLITESIANDMLDIKWHGTIHVALDRDCDIEDFKVGMNIAFAQGMSPHKFSCYIYCHDEKSIPSAVLRWNTVRDMKIDPFLMVNSVNITPRLRKIRRRGCRPAIYRKLTAEEVFE